VRNASIITATNNTLMMDAIRTSETSVYINETTWRYIPEGSHLVFNLADWLQAMKNSHNTSVRGAIQTHDPEGLALVTPCSKVTASNDIHAVI
jgi:hypothetical protein